MSGSIVDPGLVAAVWPDALPAEDPVLYGRAEISPGGAFEARSLQTFTLTYTAGRYGLDDTGALQVVFRMVGDQGRPQTADPKAPNYVTARTTGNAKLNLSYAARGSGRPFFKALEVSVNGGYLKEGDEIVIVFGDTSQGSPGMQLQTHCESGFEFKVLADVCATRQFLPIVDATAIAIVPGPPALWRAVLPTLRRPGESFQLGLKAEDKWGNPSDRAEARLTLVPSLAVAGLPETVHYALGTKAMTLEGLTVAEEGQLAVEVFEGNALLARTNPLLIREGAVGGYWGDLHGQSGESIGINTAIEYFDFARNKSFLDVTSHQANDFQVNNRFWAQINELTAVHQRDGRFVTFPGYEWSGNTGVGGDRNVFFRTEGRQIHRSSHALLPDRRDIATDAPTAAALFEALAEEDCVVYAHVGGRYADISYAHDGRLETAMEIHSAWGTFEWLLTDGFKLGHRCGVVCNSDGHKGRPGASYPGASTFGAYGGLTCFLAPELTRDAIFDCLRRRHHYGTTGCRLHLDLGVDFAQPATLYERDPNLFPDTGTSQVDRVTMGDIVATGDEMATLSLKVVAHAPIERIDILNGIETVETVRGYATDELGERVRVIWSGAEYRGRGRETHWSGEAHFDGARIRRMAKINAWNHERLLEVRGDDRVAFEAITTGNFGGFDAWIEPGAEARLRLETNHGNIEVALAELGYDDVVHEAGGLERRLRAFRLPEALTRTELTHEVAIPLRAEGDNPLWVRVTTEDGFLAWSSPVFVFRT